MIVKIHSTPNGKLIAICDSDILGGLFEEGEARLDLSAGFYKGEEMSEEAVKGVLRSGYVINAVGEKSVSLLKSLKMVEECDVRHIAGIPYAQCVVEQ